MTVSVVDDAIRVIEGALVEIDQLRAQLVHERAVKADLLEAAQTAVSFLRCIEWIDDGTAQDSADVEEFLDAAITNAETRG